MTEEPELYDDDDCILGDWSGVVPWKMKRWTEHKLYFAQVQNGGGQYSRLVEAELSRRRNLELKIHIQALKEATDSVREATVGVEAGVGKLAASSDTLENLTRKLITLTNWLIVLTIIAVIVPVGIEVWHAKREIDAPVSPIVLPPPHLTSPPTPTLPAPQSHQ